MMDGYFLYLILSLEFDFLYITFSPAALPPNTFSPVAFAWNRHLNLQKGLRFRHKNDHKGALSSSLRVFSQCTIFFANPPSNRISLKDRLPLIQQEATLH